MFLWLRLFLTSFSPLIIQWMLQNLCSFSPDYPALLRDLKDPLKLRAAEHIVQFPFTVPVQEEKTEEELARIAERKREQGRKLQEMAARSRMEKVCVCVWFLWFPFPPPPFLLLRFCCLFFWCGWWWLMGSIFDW